MIDIHTHILPGIDDGSNCIEESISMLGMLMEQGVGTVVATPHFYIDGMNVESFMNERNKAAERLYNGLKNVDKRPRIALGAEVEFYNELYSLDILEDLCISGTKYVLVEMPFVRWNDYTYQALGKLSFSRGITPIIAHIERYMDMQKNDVIDRLIEVDALIQINSGFVTGKGTRRKALSMIKKGMVCYIGSDCHNTTSRKPDIGEAYSIIYNKLGSKGIDTLEYWGSVIERKVKAF